MDIHIGKLPATALIVASGLALTALMVFAVQAASIPAAHASDGQIHHADIVVQLGESNTIIRPITFTEPISGLHALWLSGLNVITLETAFGPAVCSIEGVGCPAANCFCDSNKFWGYHYWEDGAWQGYQIGASTSIISQTGAVEGWRWGEFGSAPIPAPQAQAAAAALAWLQARQRADNGSYGNSMSASLETMLALGANRQKASELRAQPNSPSLADYVLSQSITYTARGPSEAGKLAVAAAAGDGCWPGAAITPMSYYSPTLGAFSPNSGFHAWAMLGAVAMSATVPVAGVQSLIHAALPNGGWEWSPGWNGDTNTTALAIQALVAAGEPVSSTAIISGLAFLKSAQNGDGGFAYDPVSPFGRDSDANSTAYVAQALAAAGEDPTGPAWTISDANPIGYLLNLQLADGSFEWQKGAGVNELSTQQAVSALLRAPYPVRVGVEACYDIYLPMIGR